MTQENFGRFPNKSMQIDKEDKAIKFNIEDSRPTHPSERLNSPVYHVMQPFNYYQSFNYDQTNQQHQYQPYQAANNNYNAYNHAYSPSVVNQNHVTSEEMQPEEDENDDDSFDEEAEDAFIEEGQRLVKELKQVIKNGEEIGSQSLFSEENGSKQKKRKSTRAQPMEMQR